MAVKIRLHGKIIAEMCEREGFGIRPNWFFQKIDRFFWKDHFLSNEPFFCRMNHFLSNEHKELRTVLIISLMVIFEVCSLKLLQEVNLERLRSLLICLGLGFERNSEIPEVLEKILSWATGLHITLSWLPRNLTYFRNHFATEISN